MSSLGQNSVVSGSRWHSTRLVTREILTVYVAKMKQTIQVFLLHPLSPPAFSQRDLSSNGQNASDTDSSIMTCQRLTKQSVLLSCSKEQYSSHPLRSQPPPLDNTASHTVPITTTTTLPANFEYQGRFASSAYSHIFPTCCLGEYESDDEKFADEDGHATRISSFDAGDENANDDGRLSFRASSELPPSPLPTSKEGYTSWNHSPVTLTPRSLAHLCRSQPPSIIPTILPPMPSPTFGDDGSDFADEDGRDVWNASLGPERTRRSVPLPSSHRHHQS